MCTAKWPLLMYSNRRREAATAAAVTSLKNRIVVNKTKIRLLAHFAMLVRWAYYACQTILYYLPFHVNLLFSLFILEEHNFCTGTLGLPTMYVHFHTFQDFGTFEVYQVTKDDENLKC